MRGAYSVQRTAAYRSAGGIRGVGDTHAARCNTGAVRMLHGMLHALLKMVPAGKANDHSRHLSDLQKPFESQGNRN